MSSATSSSSRFRSPITARPSKGRRWVVSSGAYNHRRPDLIIMAITSQLRSAAFGDTAITEWQAAGLLKPSMLKPLLATVDQDLVRRTLGRLQDVNIGALRGTVRAILGS